MCTAHHGQCGTQNSIEDADYRP